MSIDNIESIEVRLDRLERAVSRIADALESREKRELEHSFCEENKRAAKLLDGILATLGDRVVDFSDLDDVCSTLLSLYASSESYKIVDPLRQELREIYMSAARMWREDELEDSFPTRGILANPHTHIHRKVKSVVVLLAADRANAILKMDGEWTADHVDGRLSYIVTTVLPQLIAEADERHRALLESWLKIATDIIDIAV